MLFYSFILIQATRPIKQHTDTDRQTDIQTDKQKDRQE